MPPFGTPAPVPAADAPAVPAVAPVPTAAEEAALRLGRPRRTERQRRTRIVVIASLSASAVLLALAVFAWLAVLPPSLGFHLACWALLAALGPPGFHVYREQTRIRRLEEHFPDFLRDVASSHKGGLTLHHAASIAARGSYGELTPEVRKMADQLAWNLSFADALQRFAQRVDTPLVQRAVSLILQADRSGGNTADVLLAAARDAREIKTLERERRATMGLYTIVVYITFLVFLAVAAILYAQFVPQIVASATAASAVAAGEVGGLGRDSLTLAQYRLFYFAAALVQAVGDGLVAGVLGTGRVAFGLRHSFVMVLLTYVAFALLM